MRNPHPNSDYRVMENPVIGIGPEKSPSRWQSRRLAGFRRGMGVFHSESIVSRLRHSASAAPPSSQNPV